MWCREEHFTGFLRCQPNIDIDFHFFDCRNVVGPMRWWCRLGNISSIDDMMADAISMRATSRADIFIIDEISRAVWFLSLFRVEHFVPMIDEVPKIFHILRLFSRRWRFVMPTFHFDDDDFFIFSPLMCADAVVWCRWGTIFLFSHFSPMKL